MHKGIFSTLLFSKYNILRLVNFDKSSGNLDIEFWFKFNELRFAKFNKTGSNVEILLEVKSIVLNPSILANAAGIFEILLFLKDRVFKEVNFEIDSGKSIISLLSKNKSLSLVNSIMSAGIEANLSPISLREFNFCNWLKSILNRFHRNQHRNSFIPFLIYNINNILETNQDDNKEKDTLIAKLKATNFELEHNEKEHLNINKKYRNLQNEYTKII